MTDIPGLNPIEVAHVLTITAKTCVTFTASRHANAQSRTTGEAVRCVKCHEPQWKHWLRRAALSLSASAIGRKGGSVTSKWKAAAARINGAKGGRPRKEKRP